MKGCGPGAAGAAAVAAGAAGAGLVAFVGAALGALGVAVYEVLRTRKRSYSQINPEHSDQNQQPSSVTGISH